MGKNIVQVLPREIVFFIVVITMQFLLVACDKLAEKAKAEAVDLEPYKYTAEGEDKGDVLIYSSSKCSWSDKAKTYFLSNKIKFSYIDVDKLPAKARDAAEEEMKQWNPTCPKNYICYPTIVINGVGIDGFGTESQNKIIKLLEGKTQPDPSGIGDCGTCSGNLQCSQWISGTSCSWQSCTCYFTYKGSDTSKSYYHSSDGQCFQCGELGPNHEESCRQAAQELVNHCYQF